MRRLIVLALINLFILLTPIKVLAQQTNPTAAEVEVNLWPEYDRPNVLVMYQITLASETRLPAQITLRIPREAGKPYIVAMYENGALYSLKYNTIEREEWLEIRFMTPSPQVRVEYYDPRIRRDQDERAFTYQWPGDLTVENLAVEVQKPANATAFSSNPAMSAGTPGNDGLTYYAYPAGRVEAGTSFTIHFSYQKPDDALTFGSGGRVAPDRPVDQNTRGRTTITPLIQVGLFVLALLLVGGISLWLWHAKNKPENFSIHGDDLFRFSRPKPPADEGEVYCHKCGKRAESEDIFCRVCGTRLIKDSRNP